MTCSPIKLFEETLIDKIFGANISVRRLLSDLGFETTLSVEDIKEKILSEHKEGKKDTATGVARVFEDNADFWIDLAVISEAICSTT